MASSRRCEGEEDGVCGAEAATRPCRTDLARSVSSHRRAQRGRQGVLACVAACLISLSGVAAQPPYIQGSWKVTYRFVEMKGDKNEINACTGPFPFQYTFVYDICQADYATNTNYEYSALIAGSDPSQTRVRNLAEATPDLVISSCAYRPTTLGPAGATQDWKKLGEPGYPDDQAWQARKPLDENSIPVDPRTFSNFQLPLRKPYVWGTICSQFDWQDTAANQAGFKYYNGAWRHENETWVFINDACDCEADDPEKRAKVCGMEPLGCNYLVEGTSLVMSKGLVCLKAANVEESTCKPSLVGVSGGPVIYPESTTGVQPAADGSTAVCFMYSTIEGSREKDAEAVKGQCTDSTSTAADEEAPAERRRSSPWDDDESSSAISLAPARLLAVLLPAFLALLWAR